MKTILLLTITLSIVLTAPAQELTKFYVSEKSALAALESKHFQFEEAHEIMLILPADTVKRLRAGQLTGYDNEKIYEALVTALGIVFPALPELIPVPDANSSFCKRKGLTLTVTVKNQGTRGAGPAVTEVDFLAFGKIPMPTPPLGRDESVDLLFLIPPGCFDPDCEFRITLDANNQVNESNERNNIANGTCLG